MDRRRRRQKRRRLWLAIHRWIGLGLGLLVAAIGITGALLVFKAPILRWELGPAAYETSVEAGPRITDAAAKAAALEASSDLAPVMGVAAPYAGFFDTPNLTVFGRVKSRPDAMAVVFIDPWTGEPRGQFIYQDLFLARIIEFHRGLLLSPMIGGPVVAVIGLVLAVSIGTGAWLWWPRTGRLGGVLYFRRVRGLRAWMLQTHRVFGAWAMIPLMALALTGVWLAAPFLWLRLMGMKADRAALSTQWHHAIARLHADLLLGPLGQGLVFLAGMSLPVFFFTGIWLWWKRRGGTR
ncbi:PepSY-associated TM helix domain-containing protein [Henriciella aquimarina]|uniref:PepSY-associated TM helix domain-containing protein n=1 Tax=Henriciella aquimarina TaxID=545261 RepID=UPI000A056EB6|nr:PepSY-associated TM helix domain-containing protein [Henriciella aquimarina]